MKKQIGYYQLPVSQKRPFRSFQTLQFSSFSSLISKSPKLFGKAFPNTIQSSQKNNKQNELRKFSTEPYFPPMKSLQEKFLSDYPFICTIPVQWGDMDAFGHVNNVMYIRYFESARISSMLQLFEKAPKQYEDFMCAPQRGTIGPILKSISCKYLYPVVYPDTLQIGTKYVNLEKDRMNVNSRAVSISKEIVVAEFESVIVAYDYGKGKKALVPEYLVSLVQQSTSINKPPHQ